MCEGLAIGTITNGRVSEDGEALSVVAMDTSGVGIVLSFPYDQLLTLIALAVMGRTDCKRSRGLDPNDDADIVLTRRFELGWDRKSGVNLLILTMANGGKMTYALPGDMSSRMHEVLTDMIRSEPPGGRGSTMN